MPLAPRPSSLASRLTSRRGAWISIVLSLLAIVALYGMFGRAEAPVGNDAAPPTSESAQVKALLAEFPGSDEQSVLVVATRDDGGELTDADQTAITGLVPVVSEQTGHDARPPLVSEDGQAAVIQVPLTVSADTGQTSDDVKALRAAIGEQSLPGITTQVTGGPAFGADITASFDGANISLLLVTIGIVALLLLLTYRSPVLWLIPLTVVAFADQLAGKMTSALGTELGLQFDTGIISVLVFGAGTNYALLLISRYREELLENENHRTALAIAWQKTAPAILASNVTVVLALLTLVFAVIPGTRGLGIASAVGLLVALAFVLLVLPPVLAVCGRRVFWPFVPRPGQNKKVGRVWGAVAQKVVRRPVPAFVAGIALLAVMATGLIGTTVGLTQVEKFRVASESAEGLTTFGAHFDAGEAQPMFIVANTSEADAVQTAAENVADVVRVNQIGTTTVDGTDLTKLMVTGTPAPGTEESLSLVTNLRDAVHAVPAADAQVGGAVAIDVDARAGAQHDLWLIAPLVLAVSFIILLLLLRSFVAPLVLLTINLFSAVAAIGAGAWLSRVLFDQPALDLQVPILAFLFLVALGIDYTIFLVHRAKTEAVVHGTKQGMARAVASTGGVITSAGIVLAGVFAALGILPLVTLGQLGLIVGLGVLVDTLVVRTIIVPAVFSLLGDKIWWPGKVPAGRSAADQSTLELTTDDAPDQPVDAVPSR
ncbi:MMPL family transporter [Leifsonia sp. YAF41]|uniref:MMPL family transporter n=1 Tax=Leifsonia sp. YAF41 TaxID=3233086 RepID=UPI003F96DE69